MSNGTATSDKGRQTKPAPSMLAPLGVAATSAVAAVEQAGPEYGNTVAVRSLTQTPAIAEPASAYQPGMSNAALARLAAPPSPRAPGRPDAVPAEGTGSPTGPTPAGGAGGLPVGGQAPRALGGKAPPAPAAKAPTGSAPAAPTEGKAAPPPGGPIAPAPGGGPPARGPARPAIKLLMPEPPATLSKATQARVEQVQHRAGRAAAAHSHLPSAAAHAAAARAAVTEPAEEIQGKAGEKLVEALGERPAPSPEIEKFREQIVRDIHEKRPRKVDDIPNVDPKQAALDKAGADMASLQQAALAALVGARRSAVTGTTDHQGRMVGSEEQMRAQLSRRANTILRTAQEKVQGLVGRLQKEPVEHWEAGLAVHSTAFKQRLQTVENWLRDRYNSGWGKVLQFAEEHIIGLPDSVTQQYDLAEKEFGDNVCALLREISSDVNAVVAACQQIIAQARQDITDVFTKDVPAALKPWAAEQLGVFNSQLDTLNTQVTEARDNFNKDIIRRADQAVQDVRGQVQALREKAQGILGRFAGAVEQFLAYPGKAILEGLLELVGIPPAAFYEVVARIKTIINDIAKDPMKFANNLMLGIGQGFQGFFNNIGTHLLQGFLDWLLSGMKGLGIELPKDLSLKSVVTFFLQLLGLSWAKVRALLVKHIGAENVALIEKAWSVVASLIEKGPEGLLDLVKQKLDPKMLLDQVLATARNYLIESVVKKVALRILALFNPAGAIAQAVEAIYRVLKWVFKNAARLFRLVETVVNGVYDILKGNVAGVTKAVEAALATLIVPVIDFLADYLGVGDLPDKIAEAINGLQQLVEEALDWLIGWLVEEGKKLLEAIWQVSPHTSQPSRLRNHPITLWHMESEHVIPRAVLADVADFLIANGIKNIPSGEAVYNSMSTVMIYERAARIKTGAVMEVINGFRSVVRGLPDQLAKGTLTKNGAYQIIRELLLTASRLGIQATLEATQQEQAEIDKPEINKLSNKARRGKPGTIVDGPSLAPGVVHTAATQERETAFDLIARLIQ